MHVCFIDEETQAHRGEVIESVECWSWELRSGLSDFQGFQARAESGRGNGYPTVLIMRVQSCLALCDPMDHSPPGSSVQGILQARILEWIAMPSSRGNSHQ